MAFVPDGLFVALGDGLSTEVRRFGVPVLVTPGAARGLPTGISATLETISLNDAGGIVWATDMTTLACLDSATGRVLSSTESSSSSMSVSAVVVMGSTTYVVTSSGLGAVTAPTACRLAGAA